MGFYLNLKDKIIPYDPIKHKNAPTKDLLEAGYIEAEFKDGLKPSKIKKLILLIIIKSIYDTMDK